jgi:hypothetical protein
MRANRPTLLPIDSFLNFSASLGGREQQLAVAFPGLCSEFAVHDMETDTTQCRMREGAGNRSDYAEAEALVQFDGSVIRLDHSVELHSRVSAFPGPIQQGEDA